MWQIAAAALAGVLGIVLVYLVGLRFGWWPDYWRTQRTLDVPPPVVPVPPDEWWDRLGALQARMIDVEHRMQLVDQEWADWFSKSRAAEERLRKREQRAKARDQIDDDDGSGYDPEWQPPAEQVEAVEPVGSENGMSPRTALWLKLHGGKLR